MKRRLFFKTLFAGIAGLFVASRVVAEPSRKLLYGAPVPEASDAILTPAHFNNPDFLYSKDGFFNGPRESPLIPNDEVWFIDNSKWKRISDAPLRFGEDR